VFLVQNTKVHLNGVVQVRKRIFLQLSNSSIKIIILVDSYCGPNKGSCYSNKQTDQVLVIGGSVLGVIIFLVIILITYCVRKSIVEEREARRTDNGCELQVTQHRDLSSTSFSNPLANNQPNISEFEKGMNVLKNTDELLQRTRQTTEA